MKLLERILLAEDFTESSRNVVTSAIELARIFEAKLIPMHVLPKELGDKKVETLLKDTAMLRLNATVKRISDEGVETGDPILEFGSAHEAVVEAAIAINANLIIVGSGENRKHEKFMLGTTTERIIQKSEKPVYVVKEDVPLNIQHILCPVDFSATSKHALKDAITMAHRLKAELTILSVCEEEGSTWFNAGKEGKEIKNNRIKSHKERYESFLEGFNLAGLKWNKEIKVGKPAEEILKTISGNLVDLLVMGTVGRSGISRLLMGSVTEKVIREVPCSFLTIKSEDVISLQLESEIRDIENHYNMAMQLMEDGFYTEAINQFKICLNINSMHVPAYFGIAKVYEVMGRDDLSRVYRNNGKDILDKVWYKKIEEEVRKLRGS